VLMAADRDQWRLAGQRYTSNILAATSSSVEADLLTQIAQEKPKAH